MRNWITNLLCRSRKPSEADAPQGQDWVATLFDYLSVLNDTYGFSDLGGTQQ